MSVGESLAAAREQRGLSIEAIAATTRIRGTLIRAIEADDFAPCGGAVYARGHIRSIARALGIDADPIIAEFDQAHRGEVPVPAVTSSSVGFDAAAAARAERHGPNWTAAMVAALVVICIAAGISLLTGNGKAHRDALTLPPSPSATPSPRTSLSSPPPGAIAENPTTGASLVVRVTPGGKSWIEVKNAAGIVCFEGTLTSAKPLSCRDTRGLIYVIGFAPAVDLVVNGHDIGAPPSSGNVARGKVQPGSDTVEQA